MLYYKHMIYNCFMVNINVCYACKIFRYTRGADEGWNTLASAPPGLFRSSVF